MTYGCVTQNMWKTTANQTYIILNHEYYACMRTCKVILSGFLHHQGTTYTSINITPLDELRSMSSLNYGSGVSLPAASGRAMATRPLARVGPEQILAAWTTNEQKLTPPMNLAKTFVRYIQGSLGFGTCSPMESWQQAALSRSKHVFPPRRPYLASKRESMSAGTFYR